MINPENPVTPGLTSSVKKEIMFHGIPASPGIAIAPVFLYAPENDNDGRKSKSIQKEQVETEIKNFQDAIEKTKYEIHELRKKIQKKEDGSGTDIFDAHLLIVQDRMLHKEVTELIKNELITADESFRRIMQKYIQVISSVSDKYLKERVVDVKDVAKRISANLTGVNVNTEFAFSGSKSVIVAEELTPSDTAMMDHSSVTGFAVEKGSKTAHSAILARSLQIPAVVGLQHFVEKVHNQDMMILDGYLGIVILNPQENTLEFYRTKMERKEKLNSEYLQESRMRGETLDGFCIQLLGNVQGLDTVAEVQKNGADGIGLFRTEYLYMNVDKLPDEDTQFSVYENVAAKMNGRPVVIRTFDLGGDKIDALLIKTRESNPFLGVRAIRLCQERPELMQMQLRAILRASIHGNLKIMFPMVSSMEEVEFLLGLLETEKNNLRSEKIPFDEKIETGVMIEIPSAAVIADQLAKKVDFFSIGSNDLVQYTLACDRGNEKVAYLYRPLHPAVLRLIKETTTAAKKNGICVCICGEIAGDPLYAPILIGLGIRELSMSPSSFGPVRRIIRRIKLHEAENLAARALNCTTASEAQSLASDFIRSIMPEAIN